MHVTDPDIGRNVQRTRYLRHLTQSELAMAVGLDRTAVSRIEAGNRSLTATELVVFAEVLAIPVEELLRPVPVPTRSPNLTRMLMRAGPVTRNDEPQLAWFADLVERASFASSDSSLPAVKKRMLALPTAAAGELGARWARRTLGVYQVAPIAGLSGLLYRRGVLVATARFPSASRVSGCSLTMPEGLSAILINANHPGQRQRFTAAHELAHLLFDADSPVSACAAGEIRSGPRSAAEVRADTFAGALLLPKRALSRGRSAAIDLERLRQIASEYGASHAAVLHRLRELGALSEEEVRVLRKVAGGTPPTRSTPPFRLVGESLAALVMDDGARRSGDEHGYEVVSDDEVVP